METEALWWVVQYVVLPAIVGCYVLLLGMSQWMASNCSRRHKDVWEAIRDIRENDLKHLEAEVRELKRRQAG